MTVSSLSMDPEVWSHGMKADPQGYLCSKYETFLMSATQRYTHLRNFNAKLCCKMLITGWKIMQTENHTICRGYNKGKRENRHRNYFMINLHERYETWLGLEFATPGSAARHSVHCLNIQDHYGIHNCFYIIFMWSCQA